MRIYTRTKNGGYSMGLGTYIIGWLFVIALTGGLVLRFWPWLLGISVLAGLGWLVRQHEISRERSAAAARARQSGPDPDPADPCPAAGSPPRSR